MCTSREESDDSDVIGFNFGFEHLDEFGGGFEEIVIFAVVRN